MRSVVRRRAGDVVLGRKPVILEGFEAARRLERIRKRVEAARGVILRPAAGANIVSAQYDAWSSKKYKTSAVLNGKVRGQARLDVGSVVDEHYYRGFIEEESAVFVTSGGLRTPCHSDAFDGLLVHVSGRKRFVIIDPKDSDGHRLEGLLRLRRVSGTVDSIFHQHDDVAYRGDLEPGDALFIPKRWLHDIESIDPTISIALRFTMMMN